MITSEERRTMEEDGSSGDGEPACGSKPALPASSSSNTESFDQRADRIDEGRSCGSKPFVFTGKENTEQKKHYNPRTFANTNAIANLGDLTGYSVILPPSFRSIGSNKPTKPKAAGENSSTSNGVGTGGSFFQLSKPTTNYESSATLLLPGEQAQAHSRRSAQVENKKIPRAAGKKVPPPKEARIETLAQIVKQGQPDTSPLVEAKRHRENFVQVANASGKKRFAAAEAVLPPKKAKFAAQAKHFDGKKKQLESLKKLLPSGTHCSISPSHVTVEQLDDLKARVRNGDLDGVSLGAELTAIADARRKARRKRESDRRKQETLDYLTKQTPSGTNGIQLHQISKAQIEQLVSRVSGGNLSATLLDAELTRLRVAWNSLALHDLKRKTPTGAHSIRLCHISEAQIVTLALKVKEGILDGKRLDLELTKLIGVWQNNRMRELSNEPVDSIVARLEAKQTPVARPTNGAQVLLQPSGKVDQYPRVVPETQLAVRCSDHTWHEAVVVERMDEYALVNYIGGNAYVWLPLGATIFAVKQEAAMTKHDAWALL